MHPAVGPLIYFVTAWIIGLLSMRYLASVGQRELDHTQPKTERRLDCKDSKHGRYEVRSKDKYRDDLYYQNAVYINHTADCYVTELVVPKLYERTPKDMAISVMLGTLWPFTLVVASFALVPLSGEEKEAKRRAEQVLRDKELAAAQATYDTLAIEE
jgi:hypothetical protein